MFGMRLHNRRGAAALSKMQSCHRVARMVDDIHMISAIATVTQWWKVFTDHELITIKVKMKKHSFTENMKYVWVLETFEG